MSFAFLNYDRFCIGTRPEMLWALQVDRDRSLMLRLCFQVEMWRKLEVCFLGFFDLYFSRRLIIVFGLLKIENGPDD